MPSKYLLQDERVVRYVPWGKLRRNEDDTEVYGPLGSAFRLRDGEEYLSVSWCEYYAGDQDESFRCVIEAIRNSTIDVKPKARFAVARSGDVSDFMKSRKKKVRIIHEPEDDNPAHVALRGWPAEENELLERIATEIWFEIWSKDQVDDIALGDCPLSDRAK